QSNPLKDFLQHRDVDVVNHNGQALPFQDVGERKVVVIGEDHRNAAVVERISDSGSVDLEALNVDAEFAA
ncbi:hypothetical protein SLA2020_463030, partial [Shorea laevis]